MRSFLLAVFVSFAVLITACAGMNQKIESMSEDLGTPAKESLLRERAYEFWTAFIQENYGKVYDLYDPFWKARTSKNSFIGEMGKIKYHTVEIKDITVEGNVAKVQVSLVYSMPKYKYRLAEFSQPETQTELEETWLYIYENWYKEYYVESLEMGVARY